jgi:CRISPR-associated protein (TIGR03984 family)
MTLYLLTAPDPLTLADALAAVKLPEGAVAFLSSATDHQIARWDGTALHTAQGRCDLTGVFSARLFDEFADVRWLHSHGGRGDLVMLTEDPATPAGWQEGELPVESTMDGEYALWGRRFEHIDGAPDWCRALEGRLNWVDLPHPAPAAAESAQDWPDEYLCLCYREYLTADGFGNLSVLDERLLGVAVTSPSSGKGR